MISEFHNDSIDITYDVITLDANRKATQYSTGGCGGWSLEEATKIKERMESAPWNTGKTIHLVKRTRTESFELI